MAFISKYIHVKYLEVITHPFPNFSKEALELDMDEWLHPIYIKQWL